VSVRTAVRAWPTLLRIGFSEAVAYRAEMFIWILATTMPIIMLALWTAVAREAPIGRFGEDDFTAYFLATFIVRQLTGAWAAWQMNFEVRQGTLAMRLLRPMHPFHSYAAENLAAVPMRLVIAIPVAVVALLVVGTRHLPKDPLMWLMLALALFGGWMVTFVANLAMGCASFFLESSLKLTEVWLALFFVFSGYLVPLELFPPWLRTLANWLPFRYQIGLPVELMTSALSREQAARLLVQQWLWIGALALLTTLLWKRGLRKFAAYGG
jgi:ABC-2 type transport system permease protein